MKQYMQNNTVPQQRVDVGRKVHPKHKDMTCMDERWFLEFHISADIFSVSARWKQASLEAELLLSIWNNMFREAV